MDIQEFNRRILQKQEQLKDLVRRKMPVIVGNIAKRHIEDDFRKGGFTHNGFHKWQETERQKTEGKGRTPGTVHCFPAETICQEALNMHWTTEPLRSSPECLMPVYTIRVVWYKLPSLQNATLCLGYVLQSHRYQTENETWWESS